MEMRFPKDFLWGAATAAYQIEGGVNEGGRGPSIWDTFSRAPGKIQDGHRGDVACDHYHRYLEDVGIMGELGLSSYRFSVSWPRIFPQGKGSKNEKGLDFYKRLIHALLAKNILPALTLYHWDLPQALEDKGGWLNRDTAYYFQEYAACLYEELGDIVSLWITHNEPWCAAFLGYGLGEHAPGERDRRKAIAASHHLLFSHGLIVKTFREMGLRGKVGITLNLSPFLPATKEEEDKEAALRADGILNRWFLDPLFKGEYPKDISGLFERLNLSPPIEEGDLPLICAPIDFLGVNYYFRQFIGHGGEEDNFYIQPYPGQGPVTEMGWEIHPASLFHLLDRLHREYGPIPLYITENGASFPDALEGERVHDSQRIHFLEGHLREVNRAIEKGIPLKGYYVWSLMDNFEWAFGFNRRFGLIYVDYGSQERIWKDSALWYRDFIAQQR